MRPTTISLLNALRLGAAIASALMGSGGIVRAQAERQYLRPAQAAKILADSQPWAATGPDGRAAKITFNPDGTGTFDGPMTMSTSWAIKGENICITMRIIGVKCHRFAKVAGGLDAYTDGALELRFRR